MDRYKKRIAVTGTHGKTTITAMASLMLEKAGLNPTVLIGGVSPDFGGNAKLGNGEVFIAEVDESDGRFTILRPTHIIIPNLEREHTEYYRSESHLLGVFRRFLSAQSGETMFFYRIEDANLRALAGISKGRAVNFGFSEKADLWAGNIKIEKEGIDFDCFHKKKKIGRFNLRIPGIHNVTNALACISLGLKLGIGRDLMKQALVSYKGVGRRFEIIGAARGAKVVEDYAHHPTEIRATISAAYSTGPKRLITVFQPHRYTRTRSFYKEFADSFAGSNEVILTDVYPAAEEKIKGADTESIYNIMARNRSLPTRLLKKDKIPGYLSRKVKAGDLILVLGAGDIGKVARKILTELR